VPSAAPLDTFGFMDSRQPRPAVAADSTATPDAAALFDRREMVMVHDMLRREFGLLPGLVAEVRVADRDRALTIAAHIDGLTTVLHHHHRSEDSFVWPLLVDRCSDSAAVLTGRMERQHEELAVRLDAVDAALSVWRDVVSAVSRQVLVDALKLLIPPLRHHLHDEEDGVLPLMEQHVTAAEWNQMVQQGAAEADPEDLPLGFGMLMYEGDPEVIDQAIANLPAEARPVVKQLAAQAFAAHSEKVHGTATPPRSAELWASHA
jgi:hemerythrin-like domain-containing protein